MSGAPFHDNHRPARYTGPRWVTPLFLGLAATVVLCKILSATMDNEVEFL